MASRIMAGLFVTALLWASPVFSGESATIYIEIVGKGEFEVIYHRAVSNAVGAAFGGLIGAGIQSSVEASKDTEKTEQLRPLIEKDAWKDDFLATLNEKLEAEGFNAVWVDDRKYPGHGYVLHIYPESYGYRMVDSSTRMVSAFIAFKAELSLDDSKNSHQGVKEDYYITGKDQYPFERLLEDDSPVNPDLAAVLEKAAKRLANKIIYSLKEN